jgi:hypothetical protein
MEETSDSSVPKVKKSRLGVVENSQSQTTNSTFRVSIDNLIAANASKRALSELKSSEHPVSYSQKTSRETLVTAVTEKNSETTTVHRSSSLNNQNKGIDNINGTIPSSASISIFAGTSNVDSLKKGRTFSPTRVRTEIAEEFEVTGQSKKDFQDNKLFHEMVESTSKILPKKSIFNSKGEFIKLKVR